MAMPLRVEYPGAYYHIMNRGNAGENIFIESVCDEFGYSEEQAKMSVILGGGNSANSGEILGTPYLILGTFNFLLRPLRARLLPT